MLDRQYTSVTSEDVAPHEIAALLASQGVATGDSAAVAVTLIAYLNSKAKVAGPATSPPQQQQPQDPTPAASSQVIQRGQPDIDNDAVLTDVECTDSEDEARIANEPD